MYQQILQIFWEACEMYKIDAAPIFEIITKVELAEDAHLFCSTILQTLITRREVRNKEMEKARDELYPNEKWTVPWTNEEYSRAFNAALDAFEAVRKAHQKADHGEHNLIIRLHILQNV